MNCNLLQLVRHAADKARGGRLTRYAKGYWITIGGKEDEEGERRGGSPVFVVNGRITKGHPSLTGRRIDALSEEGDPGTHRQQLHQGKGYARAVFAKTARKEGLDPAHLHQLAAELIAHDRAFAADRNKVIGRAKELFRHHGYDAGALTTNLRSGHVEDDLPGLDVIARTLSNDYPEHFHGRGRPEERLLDMLREGKPGPMGEEAAYEQALDHLRSRKAEEDVVPFCRGLVALTNYVRGGFPFSPRHGEPTMTQRNGGRTDYGITPPGFGDQAKGGAIGGGLGYLGGRALGSKLGSAGGAIGGTAGALGGFGAGAILGDLSGQKSYADDEPPEGALAGPDLRQQLARLSPEQFEALLADLSESYRQAHEMAALHRSPGYAAYRRRHEALAARERFEKVVQYMRDRGCDYREAEAAFDRTGQRLA